MDIPSISSTLFVCASYHIKQPYYWEIDVHSPDQVAQVQYEMTAWENQNHWTQLEERQWPDLRTWHSQVQATKRRLFERKYLKNS